MLERRLPRALLACMAIFVAGGCTTMDDIMESIFGRSMRDQASFDPYENPLAPAPGAVSFSSGNFPADRFDVNIGQPEAGDYVLPDFGPADMAPPGSAVVQSLLNPVPADEASLARGEVLFDRMCAICHGPAGIGADAPLLEVWPALQVYDIAGDRAQGYVDGYIYGMIRRGRGLMPSYGHQISHFDRWNIVNYVRQLQAEYDATQGVVGVGEED